MIIVTPSFSKSSVFKTFSVHTETKPAFSNSAGLKSVFEKLRFRDGLVWTVGLTVEIKLCFQTSPVKYRRCLSLHRSTFTLICLSSLLINGRLELVCFVLRSLQLSSLY